MPSPSLFIDLGTDELKVTLFIQTSHVTLSILQFNYFYVGTFQFEIRQIGPSLWYSEFTRQ